MAEQVCSIDGCDRLANLPGSARSWCRAHYRRWQRYGTPLEPVRRTYTYAGALCSIEGCGAKAQSRGWCKMHYSRITLRGSSERLGHRYRDYVRPVCGELDCETPVYGKGLCRGHYDKTYRSDRWATCKDTPEAARLRAKRRRANLRGADGDHTLEEWYAKLGEYDGRCAYCGNEADTKDHVVPLNRGGSHSIDNIVPACRSCNSRKGTSLSYGAPTPTAGQSAQQSPGHSQPIDERVRDGHHRELEKRSLCISSGRR